MKAKYEESENLSDEEMLKELAEYDPEWTEEKKEERSDIVEGREGEKEIGSPNKEAFDKDEYRLSREISEKYLERNFDLLREKGEKRLADELQARYEKIDEDGKREWRERKEAEEKGEMHIGPEKSVRLRKEQLERQVVDALYGNTPDSNANALEDVDEIWEYGEAKPYRDKRRDEILSDHSYEENEERLDESDLDPEEKASWKRRNRTKYGK